MNAMERRRSGRFTHSVILIFFGLILFAMKDSLAQQPVTGQIKGHVVDSMGATIRGASVFVHRTIPEEDNVTLAAHTDVHGDFVLNLPEGGYDLLVTSPGFASATQTVAIWRGKAKRLEWKLKALGCDFPGMNCDTFQ
jgi:Carboxypeptidase regulatory-like domain